MLHHVLLLFDSRYHTYSHINSDDKRVILSICFKPFYYLEVRLGLIVVETVQQDLQEYIQMRQDIVCLVTEAHNYYL